MLRLYNTAFTVGETQGYFMTHYPTPSAPLLPNRPIAMFFDIDGTLASIAPTPQEAFIPKETRSLLRTLHRSTGGAVALISGRHLFDIDRLSGDAYAAAGQHGLELRLPDGTIERDESGAALIGRIASEIEMLRMECPRLLIEAKGLSVAVHYRQAPQWQERVLAALEIIESRHAGRLCLQRGKMVAELRLPGGGKGKAIERFMKMSPFAGRMPLFAGDDVTDEDGFAAVNALDGITIKVGEGTTLARYRVDSVAQLANWLRQAAALTTSTDKVA